MKPLVILFFALSLAAPSAFAAQESTDLPNAAGLEVGQAWPSGNIGANIDGAIAPGFFYEYAASDTFALYSSAVRSVHNDGALKLTSTNLGIKANLVYYDKLVPYIEFGMGLYFINKSYGQQSAQKTLFGMNLGLGADLDLTNRFFMGMQLAIHQLFSGSVNIPTYGKQELSGRWAGFFLRGGVRF